MKKHGKKYRAAAEKIDLARKYSLDEAVKTLKEISFAKFDETVELTIWLGVDPRKADQLVLGPRGLMPNPKTGTVTPDVKTAIRETKAGKVEYRVDKTGVIHTGVGKISFDENKIVENTRALIDAVAKAKPSTAKGKYMKKVNIASTMSPGVLLDETAFAK